MSTKPEGHTRVALPPFAIHRYWVSKPSDAWRVAYSLRLVDAQALQKKGYQVERQNG